LAADYALLTKNLGEFYNFADKVVLLVGAGHGQLLDPTVRTKKTIAVDRDLGALQEFQRRIAAEARQGSVEVVHGDLKTSPRIVTSPDPFSSLKHARILAPDVVVFDHSLASEWVFYSVEEGIVRRSAMAMNNFGIRRCSSFRTVQRFGDYADLLSKVSTQGPLSIQRIERYSGATNVVIPMFCELVLL